MPPETSPAPGRAEPATRSETPPPFEPLPVWPGNKPSSEIDGASPIAPNQFQRGHGELVLLVDDDAMIRFLATKILTTYGYSVLAAENGAEGIALYVLRRSEVAVVISDLMMPVMDGPTMIRRIVEMNPRIRIVVACGSASKEGNLKFPERDGQLSLEKPYTATALLEVVHAALSNEAPSVA